LDDPEAGGTASKPLPEYAIPLTEVDIPTVQDLLGHRSMRTAMIYTHVLSRGLGVVSSIDRMRL
jgi:hypothetical protein